MPPAKESVVYATFIMTEIERITSYYAVYMRIIALEALRYAVEVISLEFFVFFLLRRHCFTRRHAQCQDAKAPKIEILIYVALRLMVLRWYFSRFKEECHAAAIATPLLTNRRLSSLTIFAL